MHIQTTWQTSGRFYCAAALSVGITRETLRLEIGLEQHQVLPHQARRQQHPTAPLFPAHLRHRSLKVIHRETFSLPCDMSGHEPHR
jgi:hypothetical protein